MALKETLCDQCHALTTTTNAPPLWRPLRRSPTYNDWRNSSRPLAEEVLRRLEPAYFSSTNSLLTRRAQPGVDGDQESRLWPMQDFSEFAVPHFNQSVEDFCKSHSARSSSTSEPSRWSLDSQVCKTPAETPPSPPNGGTRAWLVVLGGFLSYFVTFGLVNSYGTYQVYYQTHLKPLQSDSTISWIGSLQLFLLFFGGMFAGSAFDKWGARALYIPGTVVYVLSLMLMSISTSFYQLILTQGMLFGMGAALLFYPSVSAVGHWFSTRRGIALGICASGSSVGGIIWPIMVARLLPKVGFAWTTRVTGFMALALLLPNIYLVVERRMPGVQKAKPDARAALIGSFKDKTYMLLTAGFFLAYWAMFVPYYYVSIYGMSHGMSPTDANYLIVLLNAGSFFGRIMSGQAADLWGSLNVVILASFTSAVLLFLLHTILTPSGIQAFAVLYGFFTGGLISLQAACVARVTTDPRNIGLRIGLMMAICSLGVLSGSPIGGQLIIGGKWSSFVDFTGSILLVGSAVMLAARWSLCSRISAIC